MTIYKKSLKLHKKHCGKLEINSKIKLNKKENLSWAYTPGVAEVSRQIFRNKKAVYDYTMKGNTVAVVSDGSSILGLNARGAAEAIPVMEGKCAIFKEFAGINAFPICIDSFDIEEIIKTVKLISPIFGGINLEDICSPRCFEIEKRLNRELDLPVFHDDQHGTAIVVLAGLLNALKITKKDLGKIKIVITGAGAAGIAVAEFLLYAGVKNLAIVDKAGVIYKGRKRDMNPIKQKIAKRTNFKKIHGKLNKVIKNSDVFIGLSRPKVLKPRYIKLMNENPVIFALSNPEPEILPHLALKAGACIVATGRSDFPNQLNNALAFPGVFRGVLDARVKNITLKMQLRAAYALASLVKKPCPNYIIPDIFDKRVVPAVAEAIKK